MTDAVTSGNTTLPADFNLASTQGVNLSGSLLRLANKSTAQLSDS